jgi:release factor glutamine methyltransferase
MECTHPTSFAHLLAFGREHLRRAAIETPALDARILLSFATDLPLEALLLRAEEAPSQPIIDSYMGLLDRRAANEPIAYILGKKEFWGLHFSVTTDTLIPRPDTESLIEATLSLFPNKNAPLRILDLGTGSGCILLSLLHEYPNASGVGIDQSSGAISIAKSNSMHLGLAKQCSFLLQSWNKGLKGSYDLIITNPPYITEASYGGLAPELRHFEPYKALVAGTDGLDCYREIIPRIGALLKPNGFFVLECGIGQHEELTNIIKDSQLQLLSLIYDLTTRVRGMIAIMPSLEI